MEANLSHQIPLIFQKGTHSNSYFQIQKEGIQFLKELQSTKLRIIFNVSTQVNISPFTSLFSSGNDSSSDLKVPPEGVISSLTFIGKTQQLQSSNSTLLIVKARQSSASLNYLTLGYMISSLFIYHSQNEQSLNSQTIAHMASLFDKLSKSHLSDLNRLSIINSHQHQNPSLLCVVHSNQAKRDAGNDLGFTQELFKNISVDQRFDVKKVNEGLDEYFPSRAAFYLPSSESDEHKQRIIGMKSHLLQNLPGRKLLNFEITGASLEYLCYELCELHNEKSKKDMNLVSICTQALNSQKNRVIQHLTAASVNLLVSKMDKVELPIERQQLLMARDWALKEIDKQMNIQAPNCMELSEYLIVRSDIYQKVLEVFEQMQKQNTKISDAVNSNLLSQLSVLDTSEDILHLSQQLIERISLYCQKVSGAGIREQAVSFVGGLVCQFSEIASRTFTQQNQLIQSLQIHKQEATQTISDLQTMNSEFEKRYSTILSEQTSLNSSDVISMKESLNKKQSKNSAYKREISELKKDNKAMSEELLQRSIEVDELYILVERYENIVEKEKSRTKSKCQFAALIREFNEGVESFHNASNDIEKIEDVVKAAKKQFDVKKESIIQGTDQLLSQIQSLKEQKKKVSDDLQLVIEANEKSQQTLQLFEKIVEFNKNGIEKSANENINQKILIAEMQSKIMLYRKSIELITDYYKKGKSDPLTKFTKVLQQQDIKQLLMAVIKK